MNLPEKSVLDRIFDSHRAVIMKGDQIPAVVRLNQGHVLGLILYWNKNIFPSSNRAKPYKSTAEFLEEIKCVVGMRIEYNTWLRGEPQCV